MRPYYSFNEYLRKRFGVRVHRISLNAGFSCPNRDGSLSEEGCIFCNDEGFSPVAKTKEPLEKQLENGIDFAKERFKAEKFIAYFQNATNTYAPLDRLRESYDTIRLFPDIVGLFISTRPDCIDEERLDLIESYSQDYEVWIEYGIQSSNDATLKKINRGHTFSQGAKAIEETAKRKIKIGVHVILGLPDETKEGMTQTAQELTRLPISGVKLHVLHVLRDTKLEKLYNEGKVKLLEADEYVELACDFLERLNPECVILRLVSDAKSDILIAPKWINEKQKIINSIEEEFERRKTRQGSLYEHKESLCIW